MLVDLFYLKNQISHKDKLAFYLMRFLFVRVSGVFRTKGNLPVERNVY